MSVQFALPLTLSDEPSLSNFITGSNQELVAQIQAIAHGGFEHSVLYVWGATGAGKSHLMSGLAALPQAQFVSWQDNAQEANIYVVDDVDALLPDEQASLFHIYNQARARHQVMVVSASCPPAHLPDAFLPDLKTRLGWDLVYQLHGLTDDDKEQVLMDQAEQRGLTLGVGVVGYMLRHLTRDLSELHKFLHHLDEFSLQKQRALTLPLLKEWLEHDSYRSI